MKSKTCDHPPPAEIHETQLSSSQICPPCLIERYITDAQEIQKGIERRGGIFASKRDPTSNPDSFNHSAYIKIWRTFKLQCSRDIDALEDLQVEFPELAEEWNVKSALDRWNNACNEWSRVPGCSYVKIEKEEQNHPADSSESPALTHEDTSAAQSSNSGSTHDISEDISAQLKQHLNLWNILPYAPQKYEPSPSTFNTPSKPHSKSQTTPPLRSALKGTRPHHPPDILLHKHNHNAPLLPTHHRTAQQAHRRRIRAPKPPIPAHLVRVPTSHLVEPGGIREARYERFQDVVVYVRKRA
jgi:hypothetical protein